ncbi:hypothetical protein VTK26DRAFT_2983 [Humicola hyalothermophila]
MYQGITPYINYVTGLEDVSFDQRAWSTRKRPLRRELGSQCRANCISFVIRQRGGHTRLKVSTWHRTWMAVVVNRNRHASCEFPLPVGLLVVRGGHRETAVDGFEG